MDDFGRFAEPALMVLISLAAGPKHGYAIADDIEEVTDFRPGPGTLYGAIARLESQGWISPLASEERRRPYELTADGRAALKARLAALERVARTGQERLASA